MKKKTRFKTLSFKAGEIQFATIPAFSIPPYKREISEFSHACITNYRWIFLFPQSLGPHDQLSIVYFHGRYTSERSKSNNYIKYNRTVKYAYLFIEVNLNVQLVRYNSEIIRTDTYMHTFIIQRIGGFPEFRFGHTGGVRKYYKFKVPVYIRRASPYCSGVR